MNVHSVKFKAKSNVFYRGCNIDDFFTFSLKLSHKTGDVTLSHAGPNGVYNHENMYISCACAHIICCWSRIVQLVLHDFMAC